MQLRLTNICLSKNFFVHSTNEQPITSCLPRTATKELFLAQCLLMSLMRRSCAGRICRRPYKVGLLSTLLRLTNKSSSFLLKQTSSFSIKTSAETTEPITTLACTSPFSGEVLAEFTSDNESTIVTKVQAAWHAQKQWQDTSFEKRSHVLSKFHDIVKKRIDELSITLAKEVGKPIKQARGWKGCGRRPPTLTLTV